MKVPMISFRRPKNLKDNLVRAKMQPLEEKVNGIFCYGKTRCKVCNYGLCDYDGTVNSGRE